MAKDRPPKIFIDKWLGRISNKSPHTNPAAGVECNNLSTVVPGELRVRKGMRTVTFSNDQASTTNDVISMTSFNHPVGQMVIYEDSGGNVRIGKGAT